MERYTKYKDSGIAWLGEIPEHWECIKFKRLTPIKRGASPRPIADPVYFDPDGEYAWVRIADVTASERYLETTTQKLSELGKSYSVSLEPDELFLSIAGSVGKPIITKIKCCIHDGFVYFPNLKANKEFVYYIFSTGQPYLGLGKLGTQLNLNTDTVGGIEIGLPPLEEQRLIAAYLDRKTAEIDELIAQKERLIALYEEEKTAIINEAVTKGINPDVKLKPTAIDWLGDIPEHWKVKKLKYITPNITVGIVITPAKYYVDSGVACLRSLNVKENYLDNSNLVFISPESNELLEKSKIHKDDLVAVRTGKPGTTAIVNEEFDGTNCIDLIIIRKSNQILSIFLSLQLNSSFTKFQFSTGTDGAIQQHFNIETACNIIVLLPPLEEQKAIAAYIEKETARIDTKIAKTKRIIELQKEYRTALISEAVTGKIKIPDLTELDQ
jgi:type I restriction enzyme S subunit